MHEAGAGMIYRNFDTIPNSNQVLHEAYHTIRTQPPPSEPGHPGGVAS